MSSVNRRRSVVFTDDDDGVIHDMESKPVDLHKREEVLYEDHNAKGKQIFVKEETEDDDDDEDDKRIGQPPIPPLKFNWKD